MRLLRLLLAGKLLDDILRRDLPAHARSRTRQSTVSNACGKRVNSSTPVSVTRKVVLTS